MKATIVILLVLAASALHAQQDATTQTKQQEGAAEFSRALHEEMEAAVSKGDFAVAAGACELAIKQEVAELGPDPGRTANLFLTIYGAWNGAMAATKVGDRAAARKFLTMGIDALDAIARHEPSWNPKIVAYRKGKMQKALDEIRQD